MLKVLYLPLNDADSVQQGMYDAWNNVGVQLQICDFYREWLRTKNKVSVEQDFLDKVRDFQPNLIHMQLQFTGLLNPSVLDRARQLCPGVVITNWSGDVRDSAIRDFVKMSPALDHALISSTGQLDMYRNAGCKNIKYWQIGYDPNFNFPMNKTEFDYDVSFIGRNYGKVFPDSHIRVEAANALSNNFGKRFVLFGTGFGDPRYGHKACAPKDCNVIYNSSVCPLSISNFNSISHYFSDRLLGCLASGRPTISWHFPGIESYFVEGSEILVARSAQDIVDHVNYCKANPEAATQIGINGYNKVLKEHTFTSRVTELLQITNLTHLV